MWSAEIPVIKGSKTFITNAQIADAVIVFTSLDPAKGAASITGLS